MSVVNQQVQQVAQAPLVNGPALGASFTTIALSWLEQIHGPAATIGVILGGAWVALQIYLAIEKRWFPPKGK